MIYALRLSRLADRYLERLDPTTRGRLLERLDEVAADPYGRRTKALVGTSGARSARVGDYRIVFDVDDIGRVVNVAEIGPRGQIYRRV